MKQVLRNKDTGTKLQRYKKSFFHAIDGITYATANEHNMLIIIPCAILAIIAGFIFKISSVEWLFMILVIGAVMGAEMINTAIEALVTKRKGINVDINPMAIFMVDALTTSVDQQELVSAFDNIKSK